MKVFLDTNVLVSAIATRGLCADVLREVSTLSNDYAFIGWKLLHISEMMLIISVLLLVLSTLTGDGK